MCDTLGMKRKTFWVAPEDEQALETIQQRYGCESESQALRLAVRVLANSPMLALTLPPTPKHASRLDKEPRP
jgi:hypothetical protein